MTPSERYVIRKEELAAAARLSGFYTVEDAAAGRGLAAVGNPWTRRLFDGDFYRSGTLSLVFVQSRSGNTVAADPSTLGGGETDKHLIYEGLSCVDADAVLAGAATARSERMVFSVWHPELVALRLTTSPIEAGEPETPFCEGAPPRLTRVLWKAGRGEEAGVRFEHFLVDAMPI